MVATTAFIAGLPKAELHLHLEGTLSIEMKRRFAERNRLSLSEDSFKPLQVPEGSTGQTLDILQYKMFLGLYSEGLKVMHTAQDFHDLALAYLRQCKTNNILYAEMSFDPQAHTARGVSFGAMLEGLTSARKAAAETLGVESQLIMCINRDLPEESALEMLEFARPYRGQIVGFGLDNIEDGHPPVKFRKAYSVAREQGYRLTAHCDVDMTNAREHVRQCIEEIEVERIDHGINVLEDDALIASAIERGIHFTTCPTWRMGDAGPRRVDRIKQMRRLGLSVSMNTDDPGYFVSGYMNNMLAAVATAGALSEADLSTYMRDAFSAAWLPDSEKSRYLTMVDTHLSTHAR